MKFQEVSEDKYKGRNFVPKFQYILYWSKHPKRRRNMHYTQEKTLGHLKH